MYLRTLDVKVVDGTSRVWSRRSMESSIYTIPIDFAYPNARSRIHITCAHVGTAFVRMPKERGGVERDEGSREAGI